MYSTFDYRLARAGRDDSHGSTDSMTGHKTGFSLQMIHTCRMLLRDGVVSVQSKKNERQFPSKIPTPTTPQSTISHGDLIVSRERDEGRHIVLKTKLQFFQQSGSLEKMECLSFLSFGISPLVTISP